MKFELNQKIFFMRENKIVEGVIEARQLVENRIPNSEYISDRDHAKTYKRKFGKTGVSYIVEFDARPSNKEGTLLTEQEIFASKEELIATL